MYKRLGWIKLYRRLIDNEIFEKDKLLRVFIYCLLKANHKKGRKIILNEKLIELEKGEFIAGRLTGSEECRMRPSTFWDQILLLKKLKMIEVKSNKSNSIINVIKYQKYQRKSISVPKNIANQKEKKTVVVKRKGQ